jgi:hypothetical protein
MYEIVFIKANVYEPLICLTLKNIQSLCQNQNSNDLVLP